MISRRAILSFLGAGTTAGVAGLSTKDVAEFAKDYSPAEAARLTGSDSDAPTEDPDPFWRHRYEITERLWRKGDNARHPATDLPVHIRTKASWSPAFKYHVFDQEREAEYRFGQRICHDKSFAERIVRKVFGVTEP